MKMAENNKTSVLLEKISSETVDEQLDVVLE